MFTINCTPEEHAVSFPRYPDVSLKFSPDFWGTADLVSLMDLTKLVAMPTLYVTVCHAEDTIIPLARFHRAFVCSVEDEDTLAANGIDLHNLERSYHFLYQDFFTTKLYVFEYSIRYND